MSGRQTERREQWRELIAEQEKSGQTVRTLCREREVSEYSLYTWRQRLRKEGPVTFALMEMTRAAEAKVVELVLASGDRLRVPGDAAMLRMVLAVLRERAGSIYRQACGCICVRQHAICGAASTACTR